MNSEYGKIVEGLVEYYDVHIKNLNKLESQCKSVIYIGNEKLRRGILKKGTKSYKDFLELTNVLIICSNAVGDSIAEHFNIILHDDKLNASMLKSKYESLAIRYERTARVLNIKLNDILAKCR